MKKAKERSKKKKEKNGIIIVEVEEKKEEEIIPIPDISYPYTTWVPSTPPPFTPIPDAPIEKEEKIEESHVSEEYDDSLPGIQIVPLYGVNIPDIPIEELTSIKELIESTEPEIEIEIMELERSCPLCGCKSVYTPRKVRGLTWERVGDQWLLTICSNCRIVRWFIGKEKEENAKE